MIYVIGIGVQGRASLLQRPLEIIRGAGLMAGGGRHLDEFPDSGALKVPITGSLDDVSAAIRRYLASSSRRGRGRGRKDVAVLATGDPLLFGVAEFIIKEFGRSVVEVIPNVSVVQEAFARLKEGEEGLKVLSLHGRAGFIEQPRGKLRGITGHGLRVEGLASEVAGHDKVAIFTDPSNTPQRIARALIKAGVLDYEAYVCSSLGAPDEDVIGGSLARVARMRKVFGLNLLVLLRRPGPRHASHGAACLPDEAFSRQGEMITKEEIRVISLSKMRLAPWSIVWDIGAGSGSVALEAGRVARSGAVYAIEKDAVRVEDIRRNIARLGMGNVEVIPGEAPGCLRDKRLPAPHAVFVGGGGVDAPRILAHAGRRLRSGGRMVVNAVTMETANAAFEFFKKKGWDKELVLISLSRARDLGELSLLSANNPVFVITGRKP
jgi:precorrin-6Y C5,15-methyltransferase (decarboxylating)